MLVHGLYQVGAKESQIYAASEIRKELSSELLYPVGLAGLHRLFFLRAQNPLARILWADAIGDCPLIRDFVVACRYLFLA